MLREERLDVLDEHNAVIGSATRKHIYKNGLSHRVVHVLVVSGDSIFLVRRAMSVSYLPGYFCSSAGGHVQSGETFENAALRELEEEIGLSGPIMFLAHFDFTHEFRIHVAVFIREFDRDKEAMRLSPIEVMDGRFYSLKEIGGLDRSMFHPQLGPCLELVKAHIQRGKVGPNDCD